MRETLATTGPAPERSPEVPGRAAGAGPASAPAPVVPTTWAAVGLPPESVGELLLKTLYAQGAQTGLQLAESIRLPFELIDELLLSYQQRRLAEVRGATGNARGAYRFDLTAEGRDRAREAMGANQYVGPAPVPLAQYLAVVARQSVKDVHVTRERIQEGLRHIVLSTPMLDRLGPAVNSARSIFLYGESGNGKTMIAHAVAELLGGAIYVPYAVDVQGQIMVVHDPVFHTPAEEPEATALSSLWRMDVGEHDRRYARVRRPVVAAGGELTLGQLDLQYDHATRMYQAPFQIKANGGVLIIDDFGRQQVPPRDLLNRWIVPLEQRMDYLTLHTGAKFPIPFDCLLILSTNLDPADLMDEAFLRRIGYKLLVEDPTRVEYEEIFRRCCRERSIDFSPHGVDHIYDEMYRRREIPVRSCHPRDVLDHLCDVARFLGVEPALTDVLLDRACDSYFLSVSAQLAERQR